MLQTFCLLFVVQKVLCKPNSKQNSEQDLIIRLINSQFADGDVQRNSFCKNTKRMQKYFPVFQL